MALKDSLVAVQSRNTTFIKEQRDLRDSSWVMINLYKTVRGYSYEQVLEFAAKTKADLFYSGEEISLKLKAKEETQ